jgi:gluconolactonase
MLPLLLSFAALAPAAEPPSNIFHAEAVPGSPTFTASGIVWWKDRLIISERVGKKLVAFTAPDKFETLREIDRAVGLGVDPDGNLVVAEKEPARVSRISSEGKQTVLADADVGTPHFLTVHTNGTIYWSGFPDGGTRSLAPGGKVAVHTPRIVHTYGIGLSPKQDWLYVASKIPNADKRGVWRFPLDDKGKPGEGELFLKTEDLKPEFKDLPPAKDGAKNLTGWIGRLQGLAVDPEGNICIAGAESHNSGEAVAVIDPTGKKVIAMILGVPRNISGLAFGGKEGRTLFITGAGEYKLFRAELPALR